MPRGRKPKVDPSLAPKEDEKKLKSPWDKGDEMTGGINKEEFSQAVIEKNRQMSKKIQIASIPSDRGSSQRRHCITINQLVDQTRGHGTGLNLVYAEVGSQDNVSLYYYKDETDDEVIKRLREKKVELQKLQEELAE